tara:strand:- start:20868 stop:21164 length:297 start_codon:yes stop_codon:yes gene_type:complete
MSTRTERREAAKAAKRARKKREKAARRESLSVIVPGGDLEKTEFNQWVLAEFSMSELAKINREIYLNPDHVMYFVAYHAEEYEWCKQYLLDNRHLLKG